MNSAEMDPTPWHDVPLSIAPLWRTLFDASTEGVNLAAPCPVCTNSALHRWFWLARSKRIVESGRSWQGKGSQWQWCSACRSYEHSSGLVPDWWESALEVPESDLRHDPGPIDAARRMNEEARPTA
jgi:hypothetical protein